MNNNLTGGKRSERTRHPILQSDTLSVGAIIALLSLLFLLLRPDFFSGDNITVLIRSFTITATVGIAQMVIIGVGGMNLSIGAIGGLSGVVCGGMMDAVGAPVWLSVIAALLTGAACGTVNGWLIGQFGSTGVASFIVTLATSSLFMGINLGLTQANPYYDLPESFIKIGKGSTFGISNLLLLLCVIAVIVALMFSFTGIGKRILSIGGNAHAARLSGISIKAVVLKANIISGIIAAGAAIMLTARMGSAQPTAGSDWMLFSFAAPIIGGTSLSGGKVSTFGAILGAILLTEITNGLVHLNVDVYYTTLIQGLVIFAAVSIDRIRTVRMERREALLRAK